MRRPELVLTLECEDVRSDEEHGVADLAVGRREDELVLTEDTLGEEPEHRTELCPHESARDTW